MEAISVRNLSVSYENNAIIENMDLSFPKGKISIIIGANGCGKSTILKTIARILKAKSGEIYINDLEISKQRSNKLAKAMAVLPQSPVTPKGLTVEELVAYGRFPHQNKFGSLKKEDKEIIEWALKETGILEFKERPIEALSGGQRQRAWIAMALAQKTDIVVLDEPTTYLDLAHQLDILNLLQKLNKTQKRTIVMVIHELNNAARFADHMVGIKKGRIVCEGTPEEVMTKENLKELFNIDGEIVTDPRHNRPVLITYDKI